MSKLQCQCGFILVLIKCPTEYEYSLIPESSIEEAADYVDSESPTGEGLFDILDKQSKLVYRCPQCKRLYIQIEKGVNKFEEYIIVK